MPLPDSDNFLIQIELLRAKALAMEFSRSPVRASLSLLPIHSHANATQFYEALKSQTQRPKTTLVIPSLPIGTVKPPITLMDAFFQLKEEEHERRYGKRSMTLMDEILDARYAKKEAARNPRKVELDPGVLADVGESESDGDEGEDEETALKSRVSKGEYEVPVRGEEDAEVVNENPVPIHNVAHVELGDVYDGDVEDTPELDGNDVSIFTPSESGDISSAEDDTEHSPTFLSFPGFENDDDYEENATRSTSTTPTPSRRVLSDVLSFTSGTLLLEDDEDNVTMLDGVKENAFPITTPSASRTSFLKPEPKDNEDSRANSTPFLVFRSFDTDTDNDNNDKGNGSSSTRTASTLSCSLLNDIYPFPDGLLLDDEEKENVSPTPNKDKDNTSSVSRFHTRYILGDVPGSNFDPNKENVAPAGAEGQDAENDVPLDATREPLAELHHADAEDANESDAGDEELERKRIPVRFSQEFEEESECLEVELELFPGSDDSPCKPLRQLEQDEEKVDRTIRERVRCFPDEPRGRRIFAPLSTIYLRRKSFVELSPTRPAEKKENHEAEAMLAKGPRRMSPVRGALCASGNHLD
ncbi:hypothetical protein VNI00_009877 [Paramarasmius palmivorus]|uniref:Uncharacterized protein n=1 Tax=Paramarasmius palmivorus TaxID=297713 RepID=A0AAW0CKX8_9AGAR